MAGLKKRLSREELDALTLSTPEARASYEEARLAFQVGRELRKVREAAHLTQFEVAKRAGIDQGDLSRLEGGEGIRGATLVLVERVALALHRRVRVQLVEVDAAHSHEEKLQTRA